MHPRDIGLLYDLQTYFGVGTVKTVGKNAYYTVTGPANLAIIVAHFTKYPLFTSKNLGFQVWCKILTLQAGKLHTTVSGFLRMVALINVLNTAIDPAKLKAIVSEFGGIPILSLASVTTPVVQSWIPTPWWIIGMYCGEGSFTYAATTKIAADTSQRINVSWYAEVSQATIDLYVLQAIQTFLEVGKIFHEQRGLSRLRINVLADLGSVALPFFATYPIPGFKGLQYGIWLEGVTLTYVEYANQGWSMARQVAQLAIIERLRVIRRK